MSHYDQFTYPTNTTVTYNGVTSEAKEWMEMLICDTATSLASYGHHTWNRYTAVAKNSYGKGHTLYLGTLFGEDTLMELLKDFLAECNIQESDKIPFEATYPVSVKQGINDEGKHILYFLNYSNEIQTAKNMAGEAVELLSGETLISGSTFTLEPWGVRILQITR